MLHSNRYRPVPFKQLRSYFNLKIHEWGKCPEDTTSSTVTSLTQSHLGTLENHQVSILLHIPFFFFWSEPPPYPPSKKQRLLSSESHLGLLENHQVNISIVSSWWGRGDIELTISAQNSGCLTTELWGLCFQTLQETSTMHPLLTFQLLFPAGISGNSLSSKSPGLWAHPGHEVALGRPTARWWHSASQMLLILAFS